MQDYDSKLITEKQIEKTLEENNIRAYFMKLDFKNLINEYSSGFQFAKGEINSGFICFKLLYDSKGIILKRGCTVYANIRKTTGETFKSNLTVLDYQNGIVLLSLSSQVLSITGVDRLEIVVIIDEEKTISPKVNYTVYESFDCDDKTNEENRPPVLDSEDLRLLITELRKEVEANKVNIEDITKKTGSNLDLIQSNTTKISNNTSEIEKIKQYNTNNDSKISNIEKLIEGNTNNISTNADKIKVLENKSSTNESNISSNTSEIEKIKQYNTNNDSKISNIEKLIEGNTNNISTNADKIKVLENKSSTNESNISSNTSEIEAIQKEIETLKQYDSNNDTKLSEIDSKINVNKTSISDNSSKIGVLENKIPTIENNISENLSNIKEVKGQISTIESNVSKNSSEISKLNENISDIESNVMNVTNKAEEIEKQIPTIESKISDNTSNISTVKTKVEKNAGDITELSKRLDEVAESPKVDLEEIIQARTATTGETFDTLDERIDCEVNRLNKKIEVTMLQQDDKESHVIENTVEGMTTDMIIKGRTLQNMAKLGNISNIIGISYSTVARYPYYYDLKNNTDYTIIFEIENKTDDNQVTISLNAGAIGYKHDVHNGVNIFKTRSANESNTEIWFYYDNGAIDGSGSVKNIMVLEGDWTNKSILEYFEGIKSFGQQENKISILSHGKNLVKKNNFANDEIKKWNGSDENYYVESIEGGIKEGILFCQFNSTGDLRYEVSVSNTYIDTRSHQTIIDTREELYQFYNIKDGSKVSVEKDYKYAVISLRKLSESATVSNLIVSQVETTYEPYKEDKKDILLQNLGFDEGLRGLSTTVYDELNCIQNMAIKRVGEYTFTGNETSIVKWVSVTDESFIGFSITNEDIPNLTSKRSLVICNNFPSVDSVLDKRNIYIAMDRANICIEKSALTTPDIEGFRAWLKANPTSICYELAEPIETSLNKDINLKTFGERTYISFENSISGTSSFKAPVDTVTTIARLNRENKKLEEENINLRQDLKATTLSLEDSDLELVKQNIDMDFRLMEVEFALDIPQSTLSLNINLKNKKGEVKNMARTPYEMLKIVILSGDYDKDDYISKIERYYERGRMTKEERDELLSLINADSFINDIE